MRRLNTARFWRRLWAARFDGRGIALQTVIIMVVLVVIAGAVTAVLVNRAGTETTRLENVDSQLDADQYPNEVLCEMAGHNWDDNTGCGAAAQQPTRESDGPGAGTYQARWTSTGNAGTPTWASNLAAKNAYDTGEGTESDGAGAGAFRAQWSTDGGQTWTATAAEYTAGESSPDPSS